MYMYRHMYSSDIAQSYRYSLVTIFRLKPLICDNEFCEYHFDHDSVLVCMCTAILYIFHLSDLSLP